MGVITTDGQQIVIRFPYDPFLVTLARGLPDRKFDASSKSWRVPLSRRHYEAVRKAFPGFSVDTKVEEALAEREAREARALQLSAATTGDIDIPGLRGELLPYQRAGVKYIEEHGGRALLADEMGLGKTVQALAWLQLHPEIRPVIVVCPASLKWNWRKEAERWLEERSENKVYVVQNGRDPISGEAAIIVINYDLLQKRLDDLRQLSPQVIVLDESHYIKNSKAARTKAALALAKGVKHVLCLTGTPILNRPIELWTTLSILAPGLFPNWRKYVEKYCGGYQGPFGWVVDGASNLVELQEILRKNIMIRREKKQVLAELPEKRRVSVVVDLTNREEYEQAENEFLAWLEEKFGSTDPEKITAAMRAEALTRMNALRRLAAVGKIEAAKEWITNFLDTDRKLIVFAHHKDVLFSVFKEFEHQAVILTGESTEEERKEAVRRFQEDQEIRLFIGSIKAASLGLTLTAASDVLMIEMDWTPAGNDQAEDRCHRIGQKNAVTVWYLIGDRTFDERMYDIVVEKRQTFDVLFGSKEKEKVA